MLFEHMGDLLLQDERNRTSRDDVSTAVNSCWLRTFVSLAEFAVRFGVGGLDVLLEEMRVNVHAL